MNFDENFFLGELQEPLIPLPPPNITILDDIYTIGPTPSERWRCFINCEKWHPEHHHGELMKRRAYHARCCYEAIMMLSMMESNWLNIPTVTMMRNVAQFELRVVEMEILSYQLTTNQVGFMIEKHKQEELYRCSVKLFMTVVWITDKILGKKKTKEQMIAYSDIMQMKTGPSDSKKSLALSIDKFIFSINEYMKRGNIMVDTVKNTSFMEILSEKLKECICSVDKILKVVDNDDKTIYLR